MSDTVSVREEWAYIDGKSMYRSKVGVMDWSAWSEKERPFVTLPAVPPAMQRASIVEVPNNVNQAQVLVTRMFESLQADVAKLGEQIAHVESQNGTTHRAVVTFYDGLATQRTEHKEQIAQVQQNQQLILQKLGGVQELEQLRAWKKSAIEVMPDYQRIGELLGLKLGETVHDKIVPALERLWAYERHFNRLGTEPRRAKKRRQKRVRKVTKR